VLSQGGANPADWLPEKYRVSKDDKSLDLEASARKLAGGYSELARRMQEVGLPPDSPEAYDVKELPAGLNFEELKKDPKMQTWLKGAHAKGMTNAQIQHVMSGLADFVGGDASLTAEEATAELGKVWTSPADFQRNQRAAYRAASAIAQQMGVSYDDLEAAGLGNNPVFVRVMAHIGAQMREDQAPNNPGTPAGAGNVDEQISQIRKELETMPKGDRRRRELNDRLVKLHEQKAGGRRAAPFPAAAVR
jgi:hypothetical protein